MVKVCISMPEEMLKQVDKLSKIGLYNGVGRSELIRRAIEDWLYKQHQLDLLPMKEAGKELVR